MQELVRGGQNPFAPDGLKYTGSVDDSRAINDVDQAIVMAGSGMCSGGRIVHHLKHNLWNKNCHVFFVGYQANGTLGRRLVDGEKIVRIAGEDVAVEASLHTLGGFSAHGDREDLLDWARNFRKGASFFVTHGEPKSSESLASGIREMGYNATAPATGTVYDLTARDTIVAASAPAPVPKEVADKLEILELLKAISSETESLREELDNWKNLNALLPLLESTRLILRSAKNIRQQ
jgi:metallo-beta-lactamase family protein